MNQVDALLLVLLVPFALRGYWRGFCRESLGLAGLVLGALAATAGGSAVAGVLVARHLLPPVAAVAAAYAGIFIAVNLASHGLGVLADRLVRAVFLGGLNRAAGAVFGLAKGAALLGFGLLLAERVVASPGFDDVVAHSRLGRPLTQLATSVVATGRSWADKPAARQA